MRRGVQGLQSLERKLTKTIPDRVRQLLRQAMEQSANEIVALMKRLVPKGATGRGEESIGWTWGEAPEGSMTLGTVQMPGGDMAITIYAAGGEAFYLRFHEFGTQKMAASPFFFPAYRLNKRRAKNRITRAIRKGLKEGSR